MKPAPPVTRIRFGEWSEEEDALEGLDTVEESTGTSRSAYEIIGQTSRRGPRLVAEGRTVTNSVLFRARRIAQTPRTFSNWLPMLSDMARERVGRGPETLSFATRSGMRIDCPNRPGARVPVYEIFAEDCYRLEWFLGPLLERPITVIDIGGHVGTFSCRLAQLHPKATINAFEPSSTTATFLRHNVRQNGYADRVTVYEKALSATTGTAVFDDNGGGSGLNGLVALGHGTGVATEVQTVTFDDAVAAAGGTVEFVKIDCEGGEYDLVLGSSPASWASVQRVVIEYHPIAGRSWDELHTWFETAGLHLQDSVSERGYGCAWLSREPLPPRAHS
jgi:FkbM family methyltransferase